MTTSDFIIWSKSHLDRLDGPLKEYTSGGSDLAWSDITETRYYTNAFILKDGKVLLGEKKRGFGMGFYNGFGGKVEPGETSAQAALRELEEESGITAPLEHAGVLLFTDKLSWAFYIDIYRARSYTGEPTETDEMRPQWFDQNDPPFNAMWLSDPEWFPLLLSGTFFKGRVDYDGRQPLKWWIGTLSKED